MDSTLQPLFAALEQEERIYDELLDLAGRQKGALVDGDADAMEDIVRRQQALLTELETLEQARQQALTAYARDRGLNDSPGLREVIGSLPAAEGRNLSALGERLMDKAGKLRAANDTNRRLLDTQLQYISFCLNVMTRTDKAGNFYGSTGEVSDDGPRDGGLIDRKV